jgi:GAF domain-containing protein
MHLRKRGEDAAWTTEDRSYLSAISEQLGIALDGARLYGETQFTAARERTISEATTRMRETLDLDALLRTAAVELRQVLGLAEAEIRLGPGPSSDPNG